MPLLCFNRWGGAVEQNIVDAINYVSQQATANPDRRYIINGSFLSGGELAAMRGAIRNAISNDIVAVFAAGNQNRNTDIRPTYPGVYPEVISVAALDQNDHKANFSNFGTNVDVSAPGVSIWSTMRGPAGVGSYGFKRGTSMAAPHVSGVAALVWSVNRNLPNQQVRRVIENTCDDINTANPGFVGMLGRGRVNAFRAGSQARWSIAPALSLLLEGRV